MKRLLSVLLFATLVTVAHGQSIPNLLEIEDLIHKRDSLRRIIIEEGVLGTVYDEYKSYAIKIGDAYIEGIGCSKYLKIDGERNKDSREIRYSIGEDIGNLFLIREAAVKGNLTEKDIKDAQAYNTNIRSSLEQLNEIYERWKEEQVIPEKQDSLKKELSTIFNYLRL